MDLKIELPNCDLCGSMVNKDNEGQTTSWTIICKNCLERIKREHEEIIERSNQLQERIFYSSFSIPQPSLN